jgi:putative phage-type endonuclease
MSDLVPVSENYGGAPTVLGDPRERWLARRREIPVTASDVPAILGVDPRRGAFAVWAEKMGFVEPEDKPWMRRGRRFEGPIAEEYAEETGRPVFAPDPFEIITHPDIPWIGCTLDRETEGSVAHPAPGPGRAPLELKNVSGLKAKEWRDEPPRHYLLQVQVQMACTRAQWASLAALIGGLSIAWVDVPRHDRVLAAMMRRLERFRWHVQTKTPPEADALPGTSAVLAALYAEENGKTVDLPADAVDLAEALARARYDVGVARTAERQAANKLKALMGKATFGSLPDGSYLSLKTIERDAYEVEETSYRQLRRFWPRLRRRT